MIAYSFYIQCTIEYSIDYIRGMSMDPRIKDVGNRIKQVRKDQNLSQADLAEKMNVSTSYISDVENGKINFSLDTLMRLTEALQVSADWLLQTNIPTVKEIQSSEISDILSDCSSSESQLLIKMLKEMKQTIHQSNS